MSFFQLNDKYDKDSLVFHGQTVTWHRPVTLDQLLHLKSKYPEAKIVVGNTEVGKQLYVVCNCRTCFVWYFLHHIVSFTKLCLIRSGHWQNLSQHYFDKL
jgi:xanthine dehydrogenase iron-sulfur cluster and FAD-binding subunit A